jgi:ketosteroid isomerase-like protein
MSRPLLATACLVLVASSSGQAQGASCSKERVARADSLWSEAAGSNTVDRIMRFYDPEATTAGAAMPKAKGIGEVRSMWTEAFKVPGFHMGWRADSVAVLPACELAYSTGKWQQHDDTNGEQGGTYLAVWRRSRSGEWRVLVDAAWPK